jgi:uncharacterized membrane protein
MGNYEKIKQEVLDELDKNGGSIPILDLIESLPYSDAKVQKACEKLDKEDDICELDGAKFRRK